MSFFGVTCQFALRTLFVCVCVENLSFAFELSSFVIMVLNNFLKSFFINKLTFAKSLIVEIPNVFASFKVSLINKKEMIIKLRLNYPRNFWTCFKSKLVTITSLIQGYWKNLERDWSVWFLWKWSPGLWTRSTFEFVYQFCGYHAFWPPGVTSGFCFQALWI